MSPDDDREPVFIRSRFGTRHWVYNYRNPMGRALIVISLVIVVVAVVALVSGGTGH